MFHNRDEAGILLAKKLSAISFPDVILFAILRGGVVIGRKIADELNISLHGLVVKKLRSPHNPELAIGAILSDGTKYIDWDLALRTGVAQQYLDAEIQTRRQEALDLDKKYQIEFSSKKNPEMKAILVDDGVATGATVRAAILWVKEKVSNSIVLAVPVIAQDTFNQLKSVVKTIVTLEIAQHFSAVGQFYEEFPQVGDEEVIKLL